MDASIAGIETHPEIIIEKLVAGGEGLGFLDGKAVFVPGTIPGEKVKAHLARRRRDFDRGTLVEVITRSPNRQAVPCKLAGICGGCDWLHIRYEEQLSQKTAILREAFRRVGHFSWENISVHFGPPLGYRNRVQVHRDRAGQLGFMGAGSASVVPVSDCPISSTAVNRVFLQPALAPADRERFTVWGQGATFALEGKDDDRTLEVRIAGKQIVFSVGCFFQSNITVLELLVPFAMKDLAGRSAADLYCGVGLFGAFLADRFSHVTAVESSSLSLSYARRNVKGESNDFYQMRVEQWVDSCVGRGSFDAVVVDPPRAGLSPEMRRWLSVAKPARLIYVSCNPVTLARDLGELTRSGFAIDEVGLFDFYPQTSHVETVARLSNAQAAGEKNG